MNAEGRKFDVSRPMSNCQNIRCPNNGKAYRMMVRPSSSGNLLQRTTPNFFKDTKVRTCSSIKLVDGVPKAVSFTLADMRAKSVRMQKEEQKRQMVEPNSTVYQ